MKKIVINAISTLIAFSAVTANASSYSVHELIQLLGKVESEAKHLEANNCSEMPSMLKDFCIQTSTDLLKKFDEINVHIDGNDLIHTTSWRGNKEIAQNRYLQKLNVDYRVKGSTGFILGAKREINDVFVPYLAEFKLRGSIKGKGEGAHDGLFGADDEFDATLKGDFKFDVIAGLAINPNFFETEDEYVLTMEPIFRLLLTESDIRQTSFDISGLGAWSLFSSLFEVAGSIGQVGLDVVTLNFDAISGDLGDVLEYAGLSMLTSLVIIDDISRDTLISAWTHVAAAISDDALKLNRNRALYQQESDINREIQNMLDVDSNGLVRLSYSKPKVLGEAYAKILPAISLITL